MKQLEPAEVYTHTHTQVNPVELVFDITFAVGRLMRTTVCFLLGVSIFVPHTGWAGKATHECESKKFNFHNGCITCPAGCYCDPVSGERWDLDPDSKITLNEVYAYCSRTISTCANANAKCGDNRSCTYGACGIGGAAGVTRCPDEFPKSAEGTEFIENCYTEENGKTYYYKLRGCEAGRYLKAKTQDEECAPCPDGYYCPGFSAARVSMKNDVGINKCQDGKTPNEARTGCEDIITVNPGQYLPAGQSTPRNCTSTKTFCPGGSFTQKSTNQGMYNCPSGFRAKEPKHEACVGDFTKEQMTGGKKECWKKTDKDEYKACIFGKRL